MDDRAANLTPLLAGLAAAAGAALAVDAFLVEPASVEVTRHDLALQGLPAAWEGARVVHLSDLHYGLPRSARLLEQAVATVNALEPRLIVITGDYVQRRSHEAETCAAYLERLRAEEGILGVLGDHDLGRHRLPHAGLAAALAAAGVRLLRNETITLNGGLRVTGLDPITHRLKLGNLDAALCGQERAPFRAAVRGQESVSTSTSNSSSNSVVQGSGAGALQGSGQGSVRTDRDESSSRSRSTATGPQSKVENRKSKIELPHLLLAHSPDVLPVAARAGVHVVLCGHTHGGQVVLPFYGPPITHTDVHRRHASGWSSHGATRLYTNRGLGSHLSLRFLCRPEIAVFTLKAGLGNTK